MQRGTPNIHQLAEQVKEHSNKKIESPKTYDGSDTKVLSTGSTLLDLAISGGRIRGGGIPAGIFVEIFGPSSTGKTVLLCELAGCVQRLGGEIKFHDPEGRLNRTFARQFDLKLTAENVSYPNTPPEIFEPIRSWNPKPPEKIHGIFADSLAALASDLELEDKKDEYSRRAKLFSQELRKTCRVIAAKEFVLVCSNQMRANVGAGMFEEKFTSPGGQALGFYASLRLRVSKGSPFKIKQDMLFRGKKITKVIGIKTRVEVYKSSVWKPYRTADVFTIFDYEIDDIRANLQFIKDNTRNTVYAMQNNELAKSMDESIKIVEDEELENELSEQTIDLWETIENKFKQNRVKKRRRI